MKNIAQENIKTFYSIFLSTIVCTVFKLAWFILDSLHLHSQEVKPVELVVNAEKTYNFIENGFCK